MLTKEVTDQYQPTIGIETHVQLKTKTKLFSAINNDAVDAEPNTLISPVCFGLPGVLPVLNQAAIDLAIKAGIALNAEIAHFSKFDRKHYFYPDLPKGYQITQFDQPTVGKGHVDVPLGNDTIRVGITRAHLEEDAGKLNHPPGAKHSLVDLNRAGTPLLEIVSEPDMHSAKEGRAFAQELYYLMKYADVSNVDLYHGNMRFDVNISVAKNNSDVLGTRAEIKNINSFKAVERCIDYEIKRQVELLEKGEEIIQETRGWDEAKQKTIAQRSKEDSHDYRYFPEPDVPPVIIEQSEIDKVAESMPILPSKIRQMLREAGVGSDQASTLLDNEQLLQLMLEVEEAKVDPQTARKIANWLTVDVQGYLVAREETKQVALTSANMIDLSSMLDEGLLSSTSAKQVIDQLIENGGDAKETAEKRGLIQVSDTAEIEAIVEQVLGANAKAAEDVKNGEMKAIGFLVGQVMKESKGKANPQIAIELIKKKLGA